MAKKKASSKPKKETTLDDLVADVLVSGHGLKATEAKALVSSPRGQKVKGMGIFHAYSVAEIAQSLMRQKDSLESKEVITDGDNQQSKGTGETETEKESGQSKPGESGSDTDNSEDPGSSEENVG